MAVRDVARAAPRSIANDVQYAGDWIVDTHAGRTPARALTPHQETCLLRGGFIARRGEGLILTRKGEDLAEDIAAEMRAGCGT